MTLVKKKDMKHLKIHKCWRCGTIYYYDETKPSNYMSVCYEFDSKCFDCPKCKKSYYPMFQDINILGNLIRNIFGK